MSISVYLLGAHVKEFSSGICGLVVSDVNFEALVECRQNFLVGESLSIAMMETNDFAANGGRYIFSEQNRNLMDNEKSLGLPCLGYEAVASGLQKVVFTNRYDWKRNQVTEICKSLATMGLKHTETGLQT